MFYILKCFKLVQPQEWEASGKEDAAADDDKGCQNDL